MPKVSIVVPVYNVEAYIQRCMNSIQQQTLKDIEIIIVDDGTQDNSMVIVRREGQKDGRIKVLAHENNLGLMWTRRTGYKYATGEFIVFCDSDDFMPPDALEKLYLAAKESNSDIITGNSLYIKVNGKRVLQTNTLKYGNDRIGVIKSLLRHELRQNLWGKMYRRDILLKYDYNTYKDATNGEDACLLYQIVNNIGKMALIEDVVYYYMQNAGSSTQVR